MEHHGDVVPLLETRWTGTTRGFAEADWPDDEPRLVLYRRPLGDGEVVYFTLGHCRSHWDMIHPPHNGARWPTIERGSWDVPEFIEILRRGDRLGQAAATPVAEPACRRLSCRGASNFTRRRGSCSDSSRCGSWSAACSPSPATSSCRDVPNERSPVLVLPGFTASDQSTRPLRGSCAARATAVHGWGLGANVGPHPT